MAENTTTRVVEVQVDNAEAIKLIADYNAKIEESTAKEKALREAIKKKGEATAADREELAKLRAEQTAYKRELREVEKEVQNNIKAAREEEGLHNSQRCACVRPRCRDNPLHVRRCCPRTANDHLSCRANESDRPDNYANSRRNRNKLHHPGI